MAKSNEKSPSKFKQGMMLTFAVVALSYSVYELAPTLGYSIPSLPFMNDAVAEKNVVKSTGARAQQRLNEKPKVQEAVTSVSNGKRYIDTHIPAPPSYDTAPQVDQIMNTWQLVTRVSKKGVDNAYVFAGLKLDENNRRQIIKNKRLVAQELAMDAQIAKLNANIAQFESEAGDSKKSGTKKSKFVGANSGDVSQSDLTAVLAGGSSDILTGAVVTDDIELRALANNKAYIVVNGKAHRNVGVGTTIAGRYEVVRLNNDLRCATLSDLKTEERQNLAPVCLH